MSDQPKVRTTGGAIGQRFTLAELAAMAAQKSGGGCTRCGCLDSRPAGRYFAGDQLMERRRCRNCGHARPATAIGRATGKPSAPIPDNRDPLGDLPGLS